MSAVMAAQLTTAPCNNYVCSVIIFQHAIYQGPLELMMLESNGNKQKTSPKCCLESPSHLSLSLTFLNIRFIWTKSVLSYRFSELSL